MRGLARIRWEARSWLERGEERLAGVRRRARRGAPVPSPVVVVGPHLDDAALSCGQLLAGTPGTTVVTVFTAGEGGWDGVTEWDASCGFRRGDDVMAARMAEDRRALAVLASRPVWLGLVEGQYRQETVARVTHALGAALSHVSAPTVIVPVGIYQADHVVVGEACAALACGDAKGRSWWLAADLPYAELFPADLARRLGDWERAGFSLQPGVPGVLGDRRLKRAAIRRYRSQLRPLRWNLPSALVDERYWRLAPAVPASSAADLAS